IIGLAFLTSCGNVRVNTNEGANHKAIFDNVKKIVSAAEDHEKTSAVKTTEGTFFEGLNCDRRKTADEFPKTNLYAQTSSNNGVDLITEFYDPPYFFLAKFI